MTREVGRSRAAIGGRGRLLVRERRREVVGRRAPARSNMSPASFGPSWTLYSAASALTCASENSGPPCSRKVAEGQQLDAVAGGADLPVDLEAALKLRPVEGAERAREAPALARRRRPGVCACGRAAPVPKRRPRRRRATRSVRLDVMISISVTPAQPLVFGAAAGAGRHGVRRALLAEHRFRRSNPAAARRLEQAEQRQDDQEVREVVDRRRSARRSRSQPSGGLAPSQPSTTQTDHEDPEELLEERPVGRRAHLRGVEPGHEAPGSRSSRTWRSRRRACPGWRAGSRRRAGSTIPARCAPASRPGSAGM